MNKNTEIAVKILESVGGRENVKRITHCMSRLRLNLIDTELADIEGIKGIEGVKGCLNSAGEIQIIIGTQVTAIHEEFCKLGNFDNFEDANETSDSGPSKEKLTVRTFFGKLMDGLSGCLAPLIPAFIIMGLTNLLIAVLGPNILKLISEESDFYKGIYITSQVTIYFLPFLIAFTGSRKFGTNILVSFILAGVLLYPGLIEIVNTGNPFTVYGIPMTLVAYNGSVIPMILITFTQSWVEKWLKKFIPKSFEVMVIPTLTVLIMLPVALCLLGPLGTILGTGLTNILAMIYNFAGPLETTIVGATVMILISTGMAYPIFTLTLASYFQTGIEYTFIPLNMVAIWAVMGADIGFIIRAKKKEQKELGVACLLAQAFGGVSEPSLFGIMFQYKKVLIAIIIGGAIGGFYLGITKTGLTTFATSNFMNVLAFAGQSVKNFVNGCISCGLAAVASLIAMLLIGVDDSSKKMETHNPTKV
jgi:PTS system beta-glucosides-specific IIC component